MKHFVRRGIACLMFALLTAAVDAQLRVTPVSPTPGQTVTIEYSNPALPPGTIVTIQIDDGGVPPCTDTVQITMGPNGKGTKDWIVPNWTFATFKAPDGSEVTITIGQG